MTLLHPFRLGMPCLVGAATPSSCIENAFAFATYRLDPEKKAPKPTAIVARKLTERTHHTRKTQQDGISHRACYVRRRSSCLAARLAISLPSPASLTSD